MPIQIKVPELGESVVEATVGRWLKREGERVSVGDTVVEIETDKVNLEVGAEKDGVLAHIDKPQGTDVKVGDVLGVIDEAASTTPTAPQPKPAKAPAAEPVKTPPASAPVTAPPAEEKVTPIARRIAEERSVDLSQVTPSTPSGRVMKSDVQRYLESQETPRETRVAAPAPSVVVERPGREERIRMSRRRRTIANRLLEAQHNAAMLTTFNEVDMGGVMELREHRKESFKERYGVSLGINSFFIKAAIGALKLFPRLNAEIDGEDMIIKHYYDIGVAIGASEGLVVPVLRDADRMSFAEIENGIKRFAQQATDNTLALADLQGGTFTITNGGVFGSLMSTPILNPPQVGILGLHAIKQRPAIVGGQIVARPMMYIALSYDHRIVDGQEAVQFLVRVKELVEDPNSLLLEG
jgi:2-oxoglutarate dehydrogenase E2 component (dihydrolipoamide succinyltransferase)